MVNRTILQGRLVNSPEMRRTNNGTAVCSFRVAWSETIKDRETKLFLNCVAWQGTAELICKYWYKGKEILLEGKLSTREYQDKNGNDRSVTEMTVDRVHFCGKNEDGHGMPPRTDGKSQFVEIDEDDSVYFADSKRSESNDNQKENFNALSGRLSDDFVPVDDSGGLPF